MSDEKEVKLVVPKSLMVVLWLIASGLLFNVPFLKPVQEAWATQFVAVVNTVTISNTRTEPIYVTVVN
jgi:hypothetical protein